MSKTTSERKGWKEDGDNSYTRYFGPILVSVYRQWTNTPEPTGYKACMYVTDQACITFTVSMTELGVRWFDEEAGPTACRLLEKQIKATIRGWLK